MTDTLVVPEPIFRECRIGRILDGKPTDELLEISFTPAFGPIHAQLIISSGWSAKKRKHAKMDHYWLTQEVHPQGRQFRLEREAEKAKDDPFGTTHYWVSVLDGTPHCDCPGFEAAEKRRLTCKHVKAILALIENHDI